MVERWRARNNFPLAFFSRPVSPALVISLATNGLRVIVKRFQGYPHVLDSSFLVPRPVSSPQSYTSHPFGRPQTFLFSVAVPFRFPIARAAPSPFIYMRFSSP